MSPERKVFEFQQPRAPTRVQEGCFTQDSGFSHNPRFQDIQKNRKDEENTIFR